MVDPLTSSTQDLRTCFQWIYEGFHHRFVIHLLIFNSNEVEQNDERQIPVFWVNCIDTPACDVGGS